MHKRPRRALTLALTLTLALGPGAGLLTPAWAQVALQADAAGAAAVKGGYVHAERKPLSAATAELLGRINAYRAAGANCGGTRMEPAPPLEWHEAMERAADGHARDIAPRDELTHTGRDGSHVGQRIAREGYAWRNAAENAAAGRSTAAETLAQWMGSPGHCRNMMGAQFRHVGVAGQRAPGSRYGHYWVMVLGTPTE